MRAMAVLVVAIVVAAGTPAAAGESLTERIRERGEIPVEPALPADVEPRLVVLRAYLRSEPPAASHIDRLDAAASSFGTVPGSVIHAREQRLLLEAGEVELEIHERRHAASRGDESAPPTEAARLFLTPVTDAEAEEARRIAPAKEASRGARARAIFEHVVKAKASRTAGPAALADRLARLLRGAEVPARVAHGLYFAGDRLVRHAWVEVLGATIPERSQAEWLVADPTHGRFGPVPARYVTLGLEAPADGAVRDRTLETLGISFESFAALVTRVPFRLEIARAGDRTIFTGGASLEGRTYRNTVFGISFDVPAAFVASPPDGVLELMLRSPDPLHREPAGVVHLRCDGAARGLAAGPAALDRAVGEHFRRMGYEGLREDIGRVDPIVLDDRPALSMKFTHEADAERAEPARVLRFVFFVRRGRLLILQLHTQASGDDAQDVIAGFEHAFENLLESVRFEK